MSKMVKFIALTFSGEKFVCIPFIQLPLNGFQFKVLPFISDNVIRLPFIREPSSSVNKPCLQKTVQKYSPFYQMQFDLETSIAGKFITWR